MRNKILLVEDEPGIAESLSYLLNLEGFDVVWVDTLDGARKKLGLHVKGVNHDLFHPDIILLDIGLPDGNGTELCKEIRYSNLANLPVLFLTARQEEMDKIIALEIGGDDYVTKPFSGREVSARIKAILRRSSRVNHDPDIFKTKTVVEVSSKENKNAVYINEMAACAEVNGSRVELSRNEYHLLKLLINNPGQVFSRYQIMQAVWEVPEMSMERTVDSHVKSLRKKLLPLSCIQTQRGFGYKFEMEEN